jgi:hypothetical protein
VLLLLVNEKKAIAAAKSPESASSA